MKRESKDSGTDSKVRKYLPGGVPESRDLDESTVPAIFILKRMTLVYLNPATERLAGYSQDELLGMKFTDLFPEGEKKRMHKFCMQAQKSESQSARGEFSLLAKDGQKRLIDLTLSSFDMEGKKATLGTVFVITEVTENARPEMVNYHPDDDAGKRIKELELLYQVSCTVTQSHSLSTAT